MKVKLIPLDSIEPPQKPLRAWIDDEKIRELAASMESVGLLQPIIVRPDGNRYVIVAGHRRFLAAKLLGWKEIETRILPSTKTQSELVSLIENIQRENLSPLEEARIVHELVINRRFDVDTVARQFGKSRGWIDSRLELLELPEDLQRAVDAGQISFAAAKIFAEVDDPEWRRWYLREARENGCTSRTARLWVDDWKRTRHPEQAAAQGPANMITSPPPEPQRVGLECAHCGELKPLLELKHFYVCLNCLQPGGNTSV